jgi:hypothetical protein
MTHETRAASFLDVTLTNLSILHNIIRLEKETQAGYFHDNASLNLRNNNILL